MRTSITLCVFLAALLPAAAARAGTPSQPASADHGKTSTALDSGDSAAGAGAGRDEVAVAGDARAHTPASPDDIDSPAAPASAATAPGAAKLDFETPTHSSLLVKQTAPQNKFGIMPYATIVGGLGVETRQNAPGDTNEGRTTTIAMSRFGMRGTISKGIYIESEFEANAGPHGTSVWQGQAALQVRNQLLRIVRHGFRLEVGRVTDDSSLDYFSAHTADQLLTDPYTRMPLLSSGFNRGNGILARYEVIKGLEPGFCLNAANPTSTTSSLVLGGTFPPFSRFYFAPYQQVGRDASSFPADQYHIIVFTPSVIYNRGIVQAQAAVQLFRVNTDTTTTNDQNILGYNFRGGVKLHLWGNRVQPFINASRVTNGVVDPNNGKKLSGEAYVGITVSGGVDYNYHGRNGFGVEYAVLRGQQGSESRETAQYLNVGTTYWLTHAVAIGARAALWTSCHVTAGSGPCTREGMRSYFATARTIF